MIGRTLLHYEITALLGTGGKWAAYRSHVAHVIPSGITVAVQTNRDGPVDMVGLVTRIVALAAEAN